MVAAYKRCVFFCVCVVMSTRHFCIGTVRSYFYTSQNLFGNLENTLFHRPVKMLASPRSKSDLNSEITSLAFWFRNIFNDAPNTLFPLNKLSKWIRIEPTKNVTFISSMWITSCKLTVLNQLNFHYDTRKHHEKDEKKIV